MNTADAPKDEALFKQPPTRGECDICMLTLPLNASEQRYQACCGKLLCSGCIRAAFTADTRRLCPFCRTPEHTSEGEGIERVMNRVNAGDANAMRNLGGFYCHGMMGLQQDHNRAMELWLRAGELGCATSYGNIANAYRDGRGVEMDTKKAKYYCELAAMGGDVEARHNLGAFEWNAGNYHRAVKHWMISAGAGDDDSLKNIRQCYMSRLATKDDFEKALRAHKDSKDEMKSDQRDTAAAAIATRAAARGQN